MRPLFMFAACLFFPMIAGGGECADVTSPACPAREYFPRADRVAAVGLRVYYFVSGERPARVAFVTREVYARYDAGQTAPEGIIWRERRP